MEGFVLNRSKGSILIGILIVVAVVAIAAVASLSTINIGINQERMLMKKTSMKLSAERGMDLAKQAVLNEILSPPPSPTPVDESTPNIVQTIGNIKISIFYYPIDANPDDTSNTSKQYQVYVVAENLKTGERQTLGSRMRKDVMNYSELAYAILGPVTFPASIPSFRHSFLPAVYDGPVYFGDFGSKKPYFDEISPYPSGEKNYINATTHDFRKAVMFKANPSGTAYPFSNYDTSNEIYFRQGYLKNYVLDTVALTTRFSNVLALSHLTLPGERCLQFESSGIIKVYQCNANWTSALDRYGAYESTITLSAPTIIYSTEDIEARGILSGRVTLITEKNLRIGGDIQYANQSVTTSSDRLGAIAKLNIFVPVYVPAIERPGTILNGTPAGAVYDGVTNYSVSNDRDLKNPEYAFRNDYNYTTLDPSLLNNQLYNLDLDGSFFAMQGSFFVDGLNNYTISPATGIAILDRTDNTKYYSIDMTSPSTPGFIYLLDGTGKVIGRRNTMNPKVCLAALVSGNCPFRNELPRQPMRQIVIYGGLVVKDFSKINGYIGNRLPGFARRVIHQDRRFIVPPGFPDTSMMKISEILRKDFGGALP